MNKSKKLLKLFEGKSLGERLYNALVKIPEFKNLSMDHQGEIIMMLEKEIEGPND